MSRACRLIGVDDVFSIGALAGCQVSLESSPLWALQKGLPLGETL